MITVERLETSRIDLSARVAGDGPLVLLLHGITAGAVVWDPITVDLASDYRVVAIDQRGHGASDHPKAGYTAEDYVADIAAVLDLLGPAHAVVGHSLGGRNAILAGAAMPERIRSIVSVDYAATMEPSVFAALRNARSGGEVLTDHDSVRRSILARSSLLPDDAVDRRVNHLYVKGGKGYRAVASPKAIAETLESMDVDLVPALRDSTIPMLLIRGADSPFLSDGAFARSLWQRGDLVGAVVAEADHFVPEVKPAEVARLVRKFLEQP